MADLEFNGARVIQARITIPRTGAWHADCSVDQDTEIAAGAPCTITGPDCEFKGTVVRSGTWQAAQYVRLVGGAGGLPSLLPGQAYRAPTAGVLLQDLIRVTGEVLSSTISADVLRSTITTWTREGAVSGGVELSRLVDALALDAWRILPDGALWLGLETWPEIAPSGDILEEARESQERLLGVDSVQGTLLPGTTYDGKRVAIVEHELSGHTIRSRVRFEDSGGDDEQLHEFDRIVKHALRGVPYLALYPAEVVSAGSNTLDVRPLIDTIPALTAVPVRYSSPGELAHVPAGAKVLIGFEGGDLRAPYVAGFLPGPLTEWRVEATTIKLGSNATQGVVRSGDTVGGGTISGGNSGGPVLFVYTPGDGSPVQTAQTITLRERALTSSSKVKAE